MAFVMRCGTRIVTGDSLETKYPSSRLPDRYQLSGSALCIALQASVFVLFRI
jgi:hypothetical protein